MSRAKTERLLNLVICLLAARRFLTREEIRRAVPGYPESGEAFERSFERDKDELRDMGVPVETGSNSLLFDDEVGYRIRRDAYALPEISFTAEELSVLGLAARAWQSGALAGAASRALLKLQAQETRSSEGAAALTPGGAARSHTADSDVASDDPAENAASAGGVVDFAAATSIAGLDPRVEGNEAAFAALWGALSRRRPVQFSYRRRGGAAPETRTVEPWGLVARQGRWYLIGHDRDRGERRVFRLARVGGDIVELTGGPDVSAPAGLDLAAEVAAFAPAQPRGNAQVLLRSGAGGYLRRQAVTAASPAPPPTGTSGEWQLITVPFSDVDELASAVAGLGAAAVAVEPAALRDAVVLRLRGALAASAEDAFVAASISGLPAAGRSASGQSTSGASEAVSSTGAPS